MHVSMLHFLQNIKFQICKFSFVKQIMPMPQRMQKLQKTTNLQNIRLALRTILLNNDYSFETYVFTQITTYFYKKIFLR